MIAFASTTLTTSERNDTQIEKALAPVYGVKYFYLWTMLYTHNRSQATHENFSTEKGVPSLATKVALLLSAYCYDIEYKPTQALQMVYQRQCCTD